MKIQHTTWDRKKFSEFLVKKKGCSTAVRSNYISRCLRVERVLKIDLQDAIKTVDEYLVLNSKLCKYAEKNSEDVKSSRILIRTLRAAVKSFIEYKSASIAKKLPRFYGDKVIVTKPKCHVN